MSELPFKLIKINKENYDALITKRDNTLYIVLEENQLPKFYFGDQLVSGLGPSALENILSEIGISENDINHIKDGTTVVKKAEEDQSGQNIKSTYIKNIELEYDQTQNKINLIKVFGDNSKSLPISFTIPEASTVGDGLLTKEDKVKIDNIASDIATMGSTKVSLSQKNQINGYAGLDVNAKIPSSLLPDKDTTINSASTDARYPSSKAVYTLGESKVDKTTTVNGKELSTDIEIGIGDIAGLETTINTKADQATTLAGYGITDAYTKAEVDNRTTAVYRVKGNVPTYASLPSAGKITGDVYNVVDTGINYVWNGTEWDDIGGVEAMATASEDGLMSKEDFVKLQALYTKGELDNKLALKADKNANITGATKTKITYDSKGLVTAGADLVESDIPNLDAGKITSGTFVDARIPTLAISKVTNLQSSLDNKVDKVSGKGLSANDFTDVLKTKLDGIEEGAEVNPYSKTQLDDKFGTKADLEDGKVPASQLPGFVDDVVMIVNSTIYGPDIPFPTGLSSTKEHRVLYFSPFEPAPNGGYSQIWVRPKMHAEWKRERNADTSEIYVALDTNKIYRMGTSLASPLVEISQSLALGETAQSAYYGDKGKIAYDHSQIVSGNPHNITKAMIDLGNVDNTSDLDKPVSTAQQTVLDNKVDKIEGKGLSANDYTAAEKNKLAGIAAGAEVNVQSDWNINDTANDAFIKNKPVIPTNVSQLNNDSRYIKGYTETDPIFTAWNKSTGISITKSQVSDLIEATQALSGLMSATDKQRLDVLHSLLEEDTENSVVDSINEVLAIFNNYPEGADLVTALAGKVDKVTGKGLSTNDLTNTLKSNYDTAYSWGDHAVEGYLKAITKVMVEAVLTGTITSHNHNGVYEPAFSKNTAFNKNFGTSLNTVAQGNHLHTGVYEPANSNIQSHISSISNPHNVSKSQVGLGNVDNTSDGTKYVQGLRETRANVNTKIWTGTQAQYDAIVTKDATTLYFITE